MHEQYINSRRGKCPECNENLEYAGGEIIENSYSYNVMCFECNWQGTEWYELEFSEHWGGYKSIITIG